METHPSAVVQANASDTSLSQPSEDFIAVQAYIQDQVSDLRMLRTLLPNSHDTSKLRLEASGQRSACKTAGKTGEQGEQLGSLRKEIQSLAAMLDARLRVSSLRLETLAFQVQALDERLGFVPPNRFPDLGSQPRSSWPVPGNFNSAERAKIGGGQSCWGASLKPDAQVPKQEGSQSPERTPKRKVTLNLEERSGPCPPHSNLDDSSVRLQMEKEPPKPSQDAASSSYARAALHGWINQCGNNKTMFFPDAAPRRGRKRRRSQTMPICSGLLILLNVVYMIVTVQLGMEAVLNGREPPSELWWGSFGFAAAFSLELASRMCIEGRGFLSGRSLPWNAFDSIVVVMQWIDLTNGFFNVSGLRSLRVLRVAPAVRLIRALRYARDLRLMIAAIRSSLASLAWALFLLATVVLFFALALQQTVEAQISSLTTAPNPDLVMYYGSLQQSMLTIFLSISGGADWKELVEPLEELSKAYLVVFALFVAFLLFGLLNILAAIFVEQSCRVRQNSAVAHLEFTLEAASGGKSGGLLSAHELEDVLHDPHFLIYLKQTSLDVAEARGLFQLLDAERTGCVKVQEYINALKRITGSARAVDIATMYYENKRIVALVSTLVKDIEGKLCGPCSHLAAK